MHNSVPEDMVFNRVIKDPKKCLLPDYLPLTPLGNMFFKGKQIKSLNTSITNNNFLKKLCKISLYR